MSAVEVHLDEFGAVELVNTTDVPVGPVQLAAAFEDTTLPDSARPLVAAITRWARSVQGGPNRRRGTLLDRDRFAAPANTFEKIRLSRSALRDDVVGGIADLTEALAFKRTVFFAPDKDDQALWNLWAKTVNLDALLRTAWRQHYTDSHVVFGVWWDQATFRLPGTGPQGRAARRRTVTLNVPTAIDVLDTLKITPVGATSFGRERLAYIANQAEAERIDAILAWERERHRRNQVRNTGRLPSGAPIPRGLPTRWDVDDTRLDDPLVHRLIVERYVPDADEAQDLMIDGVNPLNLYLLDDRAVFRHTATKPGYARFADVRMESIFELLDMKSQVRQKDRVHLIGGINFLVLIKQGTDQHPADPAEVAHLRANTRTIAQVPIIVGDHRLAVEIVTPNLDTVLDPDKWSLLDESIRARILRQFGPRPKGSGAEGSKELAQLAGHWLESERQMLRRTLEASIYGPMVARNPDLGPAKQRFHPQHIALSFDQAWASFLMDMRAQNEISRETFHGEFEFSQEDEAALIEREREEYDDIFQTHIPFDGRPDVDEPQQQTPAQRRAEQRRAGRTRGGTRNGGGAAPGSGQGQEPRNPRRLSTASEKDELMDRAQELGIRGRWKMNKSQLVDAIEAAEAEEESQ